MRVLFSTLPSYGHFYPLVPLAWALRAAGHDVAVAAPASFASAVTTAGLTHLPTVAELDIRAMIGFDRNGEPVPDVPDWEGKLVRSGRGFGRAGLAATPATVEIAETWRPDLIVAEPSEYAARFAAVRHDIPFVLHEWGMPVPAGMSEGVRTELAPELDGGDLPAAHTITLHPAELRDPVPGARAMRFVPFNGAESVDAELRRVLARPSGGRRVCISFGSLIGDYPGADQHVIRMTEALAGAGLDLLLAVGGKVADRLPALPGRVLRAGWLPLSEVLPTCDLILHHGGSGTSMTSLVSGVRQVILPFATDQPSNAAHIASLGTGTYLLPDAAQPDAVAETCLALLADATVTDRAAAVRDAMRARPAPADVAATLTAAAPIPV